MPRDLVTLECTEARAEGKSPSRYITTVNRKARAEKSGKTGNTKLEKKKFNPNLNRHTIHREIKK